MQQKIKIHFLGEYKIKPEYETWGTLRPYFDKNLSRVESYSIDDVPIQHKHNIEYMLQENIPTLHTGDIVYTIGDCGCVSKPFKEYMKKVLEL